MVEGLEDDKEVAAEFRKQNKAELKAQNQTPLNLAPEIQKHLDDILQRWRDLSGLPERTPAEIETKKRCYHDFTTSQDACLLNQISCIPIAQFYLPKTQQNQSKLITDAEFHLYWSGQRHPQGQATAAAWATAVEKRFFHWFLEFPDIIERGGFDCILGNPPYLGGGKLSTVYGSSFNAYVKHYFAPAHGQVDLLIYFIRRMFQLLAEAGVTGVIGTKTVAQGDSRLAGLHQIIHEGGCMAFAYTATRWPGEAAVDVALFGFTKQQWLPAILNGRSVETINSNLSDGTSYTEPVFLASQKGLSFKGSEPVGDGFLLSHNEAAQLVLQYPQEADCIRPFLIGDDISNSPRQEPSRKCIYFDSLSLAECQIKYPNLLEIIRARVYTERSNNNDKHRREVWWQFSRPTIELYSSVRGRARIFAINRHAKYLAVAVVSPMLIYSDATVVIVKDTWRSFALYSSNIHEAWAWFRGSTMGSSTLRFTPSSVYGTFAEPDLPSSLDPIGERYHEHRCVLMLKLWLGLTDIYNLFHSRELTAELVAKVSKKCIEEANAGYQGLLSLRRLHQALDEAVRDAYGWQDLKLDHDFYEVETLPENDRVRYTISPIARKEVLLRLLALNHERAKAEQAAQAVASSAKQLRGRRTKPNGGSPSAGLFSGEEDSCG